MNRRDRRKQKKKKERQGQLRREKHLQRSPPVRLAEDKVEERAPNDGEELWGTAPVAGPPPEAPLDNFFLGEPAHKWLDALLAGTDTMPIVRALEPADYVPADLLLKAAVCCEILVAAELVAAGRGRPSRHLPAAVAAWLLERDILFSPGVVAMATRAVRRVGEFSELRHLWDTVRRGSEWLRGVEGLIGRLER
jgi:Domain of unknown function (DUF4259)